MSDYDEDDDYYTGMSSVEEDVALPLLTVDDIFIHQHFIYGTQTRDGLPVPVCYKMNTKGNIGKINSVICPDDINVLSECVNNFNHGWEMMNSTQRWPGPIKKKVGIQLWNVVENDTSD